MGRGSANMRSMVVGLSIGYSTSNQSDGQTVILSVDDQESLERLVEVELTPEQFTALLSSRYLTVPASSTRKPERLGLRRSTEEHPLPDMPYAASKTMQEEARQAIADANPGAEVYLRRGRGWSATVVRWGVSS
jgi:hypothetical protein